MDTAVTLESIQAARARIGKVIYHSPCPYSLNLSRLCGCIEGLRRQVPEDGNQLAAAELAAAKVLVDFPADDILHVTLLLFADET